MLALQNGLPRRLIRGRDQRGVSWIRLLRDAAQLGMWHIEIRSSESVPWNKSALQLPGVVVMPADAPVSWRFQIFMLAKAIMAPCAFGVSAAIIDERGQVLLVKHTYMRGWQLPSGGVNRGEPASVAVAREMNEEVGLQGGTSEFLGIFTRKSGWATNVVAFFRITEGTVNFKANLEIREICFADPSSPPDGCTAATLRRLQELAGAKQQSVYW